MGDSWEDWDDDNYAPALPGAAAGEQAKDKFADEVTEVGDEPEPPKYSVPKPQQSKKGEGKKYDESRGVSTADDGPLDDPIAEKLRQQRLVEEADFKATMELFGSGRDLEGFIPKSARDFEEYAGLVVAKYLAPQAKSPHYKLLLKQLLKHALVPVTAQDAKDVETSVAGIRADKLKEEKAVAGGKKTAKKAALNVGKSGGSAGLDDYVFDDNGDDDYKSRLFLGRFLGLMLLNVLVCGIVSGAAVHLCFQQHWWLGSCTRAQRSAGAWGARPKRGPSMLRALGAVAGYCPRQLPLAYTECYPCMECRPAPPH